MVSESSPLQRMVNKLGFWTKLDDADRAALLALPYELKHLRPQQTLVSEGDRATHSALMVSGYSYRQKTVRDGGRQIIALQVPGDLVDLQNSLLQIADHEVQALTDAEFALIPREAIVELAFERPAVGYAMWYDTLVDASIAREWAVNIGRRDARTRMAHMLCEFAVRLRVAGGDELSNYVLPMNQEQLADALALTPVHVNRTIRALEAEGLISRASSRAIHIGDWKTLADAGDFDPTYLHFTVEQMTLP